MNTSIAITTELKQILRKTFRRDEDIGNLTFAIDEIESMLSELDAPAIPITEDMFAELDEMINSLDQTVPV